MKLRNLLKGLSPLSLVLLIFGCIICAVTMRDGELFHLLMPAHDYDYVLEHGVKAGDHIKGDIYFSFGKFATQSTYTQYETYRTGSKVSGYYYAIPAGESGMAAVYVRKDDKALMEQLTDETYDYLNSYVDGGLFPQTVLHFNGIAVPMEKSLKGLESAFKKQLKEWDYTEAEIDEMLAQNNGAFLVLEGPADVTVVYVMAGIGLVLIALAVFFFVRRYKKEMAWMKKREDEWTKV